MTLVFKGEVQLWERRAGGDAVFLGPLVWRIEAERPTLAMGDLEGLQGVRIEAPAAGIVEAPDSVEALRLVPPLGDDTILLVFEDDEGAQATGREILVRAEGPTPPPPDEGQSQAAYLAGFEVLGLTFNIAGAPLIAPPYGFGQLLDLRESEAFEFLGEIGTSLLSGDAAARKARVETVALLYEAALDRDGEIDEGGLNFWIDRAAAGRTDIELARAFMESPEFTEAFGAPGELSDPAFVETLYENVLDRAPDPLGSDFWSAALERLGGVRELFVLAFALSPENREGSPLIADLVETDPGIWEFPI